jgi:transcription elongation factor Elf1
MKGKYVPACPACNSVELEEQTTSLPTREPETKRAVLRCEMCNYRFVLTISQEGADGGTDPGA